MSSELNLEGLLPRLMAILIENAGAQRGLFVLESRGSLQVEVESEATAAGTVTRPLSS